MNNFESNENSKKIPNLYPNEAYEKESISSAESVSNDQNNMQNLILPLLLQALNGNESLDLGKILSLMPNSQNNSLGLINALSNLNKNKKKEVAKFDTSEKPFPKNEFIY